MSIQLPLGANLTHLKKQAKKLRSAITAGEVHALARLRAIPEASAAVTTRRLSTALALLVIAREYGFPSWPKLKQAVEGRSAHDPVESFLLAACHGRPSQVGALLADQIDAIRADPWAAAAAGEGESVEVHLRRDANLASVAGGPLKRTPLQYLCWSNVKSDRSRLPGFLRSLRALLAAGADPNAHLTDVPKDHPKTSLYGTLGHPELMLVLLDAGAHVNRDHDSETLYHATEQSDLSCLKLLLEHPKLDRDWASYCLLRMLDFDSVEGVRLFMKAGVDVNEPIDANAETALLKAVRRPGRSPEVVRLLLEHGADPSRRNELGASPYALARRAGNREIAELLRRDGDTEELPPSEEFIAACGDGDAERAKRIARENSRLIASLTPLQLRALMQFSLHGRHSAVRAMLDAGVPVDARDDKNLTAMHGAAFKADLPLIDELLGRSAPLDVRDTIYDATPLDHVLAGSLYDIEDGHAKLVDRTAALERLIAAGSPLPERAWGSEEMLAVLRKHGVT